MYNRNVANRFAPCVAATSLLDKHSHFSCHFLITIALCDRISSKHEID